MKVRDDTYIEWDSFPPHGGRGLGAVNLIKNKHYKYKKKQFGKEVIIVTLIRNIILLNNKVRRFHLV
jgi:hypothetical protein